MNACQLRNPKIWPLFTTLLWVRFHNVPKPEVGQNSREKHHRDVKLGREARQDMHDFLSFALSVPHKYQNCVGIVNPFRSMEHICSYDSNETVISLTPTTLTFASTWINFYDASGAGSALSNTFWVLWCAFSTAGLFSGRSEWLSLEPKRGEEMLEKGRKWM